LLAETVAELETQEAALATAEATYRQQEDHRREVEDLRRRIGEEAAGRRAEREALERSLASAEHERERLAGDFAAVNERIATIEAERETVERDIEQMDGSPPRWRSAGTGSRTNAGASRTRCRSSKRRGGACRPARTSPTPA